MGTYRLSNQESPHPEAHGTARCSGCEGRLSWCTKALLALLCSESINVSVSLSCLAQIRLLREEREIGEMQSCTFEPRTNRGILRAAGPVLVRGLGRHLELRNVAEQQEIDRQEREARAFGVRPGAPRRTMLGETMLEPFTLSEGNCRGWWEARRRQHEAERAAQLTFKPWTLEGKRSGTLSEVPESPSILSEKTFVTSILDSAERPVSRNS